MARTSSKWGKFWLWSSIWPWRSRSIAPPPQKKKKIGILPKVFYTYGPNLVILSWTGDELSRGQAHDWRTHRQTDAGNDNTRRPKLASGKNYSIHMTIQLHRWTCNSTFFLAHSSVPLHWFCLRCKFQTHKLYKWYRIQMMEFNGWTEKWIHFIPLVLKPK